MAQVFDVNGCLERIGDYAWFVTDEGVEVLAFKYKSTSWAFYSIVDAGFNGSNAPRMPSVIREFPFLGRFNFSWIVNGGFSLQYGVNDVDNDSIAGILRIVTSPKALPDNATINQEESSDEATTVSEYIDESYEKTSLYQGYHGYHYHHSVYMNAPKERFTGHRIGIELEVEFHHESERSIFCDKKSNWFYRESDASLGNFGCEIITIPLLPKHAKSVDFWKTLTDTISSKARSWDTGRCGLHVHIGREILGRTDEEKSETIGRLLYLYHHFVKDTRMNVQIYGRDRGYHDQDGKTEYGNSAKLLGSDVLKIKEVKDKVKKAMIDRSTDDRYFDINLRNTHTIEFRKGRGSINPVRIAMVVDYCERMCVYAKSTPWQQIGYDDFVKFLKATVKNERLIGIVNDYA